MNVDYLSQLPVDLFIQQMTYLPFDDVISVCQANTTLHNYCINSKYNNNWKNLIDNTFSSIYNYDDYLKEIRNKLKVNDTVYNYLVYTHLVELLDPITQLMIYYRQGDKIFDSPNFTNVQKFLALFLLGKKDKMKIYLPSDNYLPFINMLEGDKISQNILDKLLAEMAEEGSVKGLSMMLSKGADVHADDDYSLIIAIQHGHLEVVKYLTEHGSNVHGLNDCALAWASQKGHLEIVKYLVEQGANIHNRNDYSLRWASRKGHLEVVKYLENVIK